MNSGPVAEYSAVQAMKITPNTTPMAAVIRMSLVRHRPNGRSVVGRVVAVVI